MPLPAPRKGEKKKDFISRCMGNSTMNNEFPKQAQRFKVCQSQWNKKQKGEVAKCFEHEIHIIGS